MQKFLIVNIGSSSIKYSLFLDTSKILFRCVFKNFSENEYTFEYSVEENNLVIPISVSEFSNSLNYLLEFLIRENYISDISEISLIGHRIVHGGEIFKGPVELNEEVLNEIQKFNDFAPLHNPISVELIKNINFKFPKIRQIGVFDTSFHLSNKKEQFLYGLPYGYYKNIGVRRFGFHGINYNYITKTFSKFHDGLKKIVICHLGSGSSVCAVKNEESFDHSFGFTPNENLLMSTRCGEIDYDAVKYLKIKLAMSEKDVSKLLNTESGLLGISGYTKDMETLVIDYLKNDRAKLAVDIYVAKIVNYIAQFYVNLDGIDALIFTGTIGFKSSPIRELIVDKLKSVNIFIDKEKNRLIQKDLIKEITLTNSIVRTFIIEPNEELQIFNEIKLFL